MPVSGSVPERGYCVGVFVSGSAINKWNKHRPVDTQRNKHRPVDTQQRMHTCAHMARADAEMCVGTHERHADRPVSLIFCCSPDSTAPCSSTLFPPARKQPRSRPSKHESGRSASNLLRGADRGPTVALTHLAGSPHAHFLRAVLALAPQSREVSAPCPLAG
eukprot:1025968-Rhodomonas_salina.1